MNTYVEIALIVAGAWVLIVCIVLLACARFFSAISQLPDLDAIDGLFSEADEQRFYRAGGCPKCGAPPGTPCDSALHS